MVSERLFRLEHGPLKARAAGLLLCTVLLAAGWSAASPEPAAGADMPGAAVRLPDAIAPTSYRITIVPDAKLMTFSGEVQIALDVDRPVEAIVLNAADLEFDRVSLDGAMAGQVTFDAEAETATLSFGHALQPGTHTLDIAYRGKINTSASGLFALDYDTAEGHRRMLATQFESADARRFVPSWDEPDRKATFQLTAIVPEGQLAVSNTPEEFDTRPRRRIEADRLPGNAKDVVLPPVLRGRRPRAREPQRGRRRGGRGRAPRRGGESRLCTRRSQRAPALLQRLFR